MARSSDAVLISGVLVARCVGIRKEKSVPKDFCSNISDFFRNWLLLSNRICSLVSRPARKSKWGEGHHRAGVSILPECHALLENGEENEKASADSYQ